MRSKQHTKCEVLLDRPAAQQAYLSCDKEEDTNIATKRDSITIQISRFNSQSNLSLQTSIREIAIFVLSHRNLKVYKRKGKQLHHVSLRVMISG